MSTKFKLIIIVNILIVSLFLYFNWANWTLLNDERTALPISSKWGPIWIQVQPRPHLWESAIVSFPNYPLMLFLLSTTLNLYFLIELKNKKKKN